MEKLEKYRQAVYQLLKTHSASGYDNGDADIECQLVFDTEGNHYQLLDIGWEGFKRIYNCLIHIDIKEEKIWIQRNMTEADLAEELIEMGVLKDDIILGLHPPYKRPLTGYGVG
ncbi:MAG: XisI protein [Cyanobacteria bacterium P01_C01_bin.38]